MRVRTRVSAVLGVLAMVLIPAGAAGAGTLGEVAGPLAGLPSWEIPESDSIQQPREAIAYVHQTDESTSISIGTQTDETVSSTQEITVNARTVESDTDGSGEVVGLPEEVTARANGAGVRRALPVEERERILRTRPASGGPGIIRQRELRIARKSIVARSVGPISKDEYKRLYKVSASKYGFGEDWYVLAAVGWVESQHGENMGPSSAGAMGPMQFLPSTWEASGIDGNRDGVANIMDPADAIPSAARYLRQGGAPKDWRAALYTYNHADWYVDKVLDSAERYRGLARDEEVGPYK